MNKRTAKEFVPLVQALADGKAIQFRYYGEPEPYQWKAVSEPAFDGLPEQYRVEPEPFECWVEVDSDGDTCGRAENGAFETATIGNRVIHMREVCDD